jgi:hypothetical protein
MSLEIPSGSITVMKMDTPPPGWTKTNSGNLNALRVVNGAVSSGGSVNYTSIFTTMSSSVTSSSITVGESSLALSQIPTHTHQYRLAAAPSLAQSQVVPPNNTGLAAPTSTVASGTNPTGGTAAHSHPITAPVSSVSGTLDMSVKYVDVILVQRS